MNKVIYILIVIFFSSYLVAGSNFSGERLEKACKQFVKSKYSESRITILGKIKDFEFEKDGIEASLEFDGNSYGNTFLNLVFKYNNEILNKIRIPVKIEISVQVPVFTKDMKPGDILSKNDFTYKLRFIEKNIVTNTEALLNTKITRSVKAGEIIYPNLFEQIPVIERGNNVDLRVVSGKVEIKAIGEALNDAKPGEEVRVKKKNSQIVIKGIALTDGTVLIR